MKWLLIQVISWFSSGGDWIDSGVVEDGTLIGEYETRDKAKAEQQKRGDIETVVVGML